MKTDSLKTFLESLQLTEPVTTRPGRIVAGPPRWIMDPVLAVVGGRLLDRPALHSIFDNLGIDTRDRVSFLGRLRRRSQWRPLWLELAEAHAALGQAAEARGERDLALREYRQALALRGIANSGDGYYFWTAMPGRLPAAPETRRLYRRTLELAGERVERLEIAHSRGSGAGLLHLPLPARDSRVPALVVLHGLGGDKESMDNATAAFREAGLATLAIDLPAHGECAEGPRLWPEAEECAIAALERLAARPEVDPARVGLLGGSLGGFFALRAAAASRLPKVCLTFAAPFDIGGYLPRSVQGLQDNFAWVLGARSRAECFALARPLHLRDVLGRVACPVFVGHGTRDHFVFFLTTYEIARRLDVPVTVQPYPGADHEVALPRPQRFSQPAVRWLAEKL